MHQPPHLPAPENDWLAYLAHDFKVPLEHIRQTVSVLESLAIEESAYRTRLLEIASTIRREVAEAESLRSGIVAHLDLDGSKLRLMPVRLDEVILGVTNRLEMDADLKEIELDYQLPTEPLLVPGDEMLLARAFQNVILNAIENTPRLGFVGIEIESLEDRVRVVVSDTGPGIPAQIVRQLSDPAFPSSSEESARPNGRGLGLIFVRRVMDLHGGHVLAEPDPNEGSRFIVELSLNGNSTLNG